MLYLHWEQAWNYTEAIASVPLVVALVALPIDSFKIFQWKCPLQNETGLALSNYGKFLKGMVFV